MGTHKTTPQSETLSKDMGETASSPKTNTDLAVESGISQTAEAANDPVAAQPKEAANDPVVAQPTEAANDSVAAQPTGAVDAKLLKERERKIRRLLRKSWTSMAERLRGFWLWLGKRYFSELTFPENRVQQLKEADESGTIVYILRYQSYFNYLIYNFLFLFHGLPLARFAPGISFVPWQPWVSKFRVMLAWIGRLFGFWGADSSHLFREFVRHEIPTLIFLDRPVTIFTYLRRGIYWLRDGVRSLFGLSQAPGGRAVDLFEELVNVQRGQERPIFICPQVLVWDRAATNVRKSFWDVVFGERESPGFFRELYQFRRNKSLSRVRGGEPIDVKKFVAQFSETLSDAEVARRLQLRLKELFYREYRVMTGPVARPASEIKHRVLHAPHVRHAIRQYATEQGLPVELVTERAAEILDRMAADFQMNVAQRFDWFLRKFWNRMFSGREGDLPGLKGIDVDQVGIERMREASIKHPLVLLPCHKSHVDYLIMSQIMLYYDMIPPHIAAGDNLLMPIIGWIFRHSGAFFLRRSFGDDLLYKAIFMEYMLRLLREGCNVEFFIEGGRSRTGKLRQPKMGLLGILVDAVLEKRMRDFYLVPISIGYDRIIEGESYSHELLGGSKQRETLGDLVQSARKFLKIDFGRISVQFAQPIAIRQAIKSYIEAKRQEAPEFDPVSNRADRKQLVQILAYQVVYDINRASLIMPSSLVAAILMTYKRRGIDQAHFVQEVEWLSREVEARGARLAPYGSPESAVQTTTKFLGKLIKRREYRASGTVVYRPRASRRIELAYYRNQILHIFVAEAFVACALESFACRRQADQGVSRADLLEETTFLSRLFKREFIYKPSPDAEDNFDETLEAMRRRKILSLSDDDQMVTADPEGHKMLAFLRHLFRPFIDSYWVAALSLFTLRAERKMEEKQFIKIMQEYAESLYQQGELRYSDAVSMENLSNALSLYKDLGIVKDEMPAQGDKRSSRNRQITLCESHITGQSLSEFVNRIGKFSSSNQAPVIAERVQKILEKSQATMA